MSSRLLASSLAVVLAPALLAACSGAPAQSGDGRMHVVASFYPLEFAAQQVGGQYVTVSGLTKPGAEPHDVELSPQDVAGLSRASLVVYEKGFQPAVDDAVAQEAASRGFDVTPAAHLDLTAPAESDVSPKGGNDPHFWLDPARYRGVAQALAARLAEVDPPHAADYAANARSFGERLGVLDAEFSAGTAQCEVKDLVTSHAAFGYLSARYGFTQVPIAGISPDVEPSAAALSAVADLVRARHVSTVYAETLVEPKFAETIARSTGAAVAVLDPVEGLTAASAGKDYFEVMRANLATLKTGQVCR
ncbi:MAG: metal ABC transporter substrate-binding protein [Actinomycetota bacterium]|nr:metal ABC transporter substrate-binding protein [Actinomycetota bacterium]